MSPKEQDFFISKHLDLPRRCPDCRKARKAAREEAVKQAEVGKRREVVIRTLEIITIQ
jgi:hypothetical protein